MPDKKPKKRNDSAKAFLTGLGLVAAEPILNRVPTFAVHYANHTGLLTTTFDISLIFGRIALIDQQGRPVVDQFAQITMSYEHAKAFSAILARTLAAYDDNAATLRQASGLPAAE